MAHQNYPPRNMIIEDKSRGLIVPIKNSVLSESKGYTLVELIITCLILGLLSALAIPIFNSFIAKAKNAQAESDLRTMSTEINAFLFDRARLPTDLDEIKRLGFKDPWKNAYVYTTDTTTFHENEFGKKYNTTFDLYSMGKNGVSPVAYDPAIPDGVDDIIVYSDGSFVGVRN